MQRLAVLTALLWTAAVCADETQINAPGYKVERLVKPSAFHGVHGLAFDAGGRLHAGSVVGQSIYRVDTASGNVELVVGPSDGMADDLVFLPDGTMIWTSINQGTVRARKGNGPIRVIGEKLPGANSINYRKSDGRLFMGQVFAGDGLWELDPTGTKPPRNVLKDIGGLNGFDFGPDGWIYGPLWFKKQVVKINPESGEMKVIADGFDTPAAANFDSKWNLYVLDTALGTVNRVDIKTGAKVVVAKLKTSLDNLAIDAKDRIFVSNMADNGIQEVNVRNGRARSVAVGSLAIPIGIAAAAEGKRDTVYVADIFAFRAVDGKTGRVIDIERSHAAGAHIEYPVAVSANDRHVLSIQSSGTVLQFARSDGAFLREWKDLRTTSVLELNDGDLLFVDSGKLMRRSERGTNKQIAGDLGTVQGFAARDNDVYLADRAGGRILHVKLDTGDKRVLVSGLSVPQGIAIAAAAPASMHILTVEFGKKRIVAIDPRDGSFEEVAGNLPIDVLGTGRAELPVGLAVGGTGAIYVTSDIENSIYKLTKR
jgi:sugar lactone lactonase YvrE